MFALHAGLSVSVTNVTTAPGQQRTALLQVRAACALQGPRASRRSTRSMCRQPAAVDVAQEHAGGAQSALNEGQLKTRPQRAGVRS